MKKHILFSALSFLSLLTFAQKQVPEKKFTFKVEGTIRNFAGKSIFLHHKWNEADFTDSCKVVNGKFSFNLKSAEPNMYWFTTTNNLNEPSNCMFFVDPLTIKANLIGDSLPYSQIEGGQSQKDFLEYRMIINNLVMLQRKMQNDYNVATQSGDVATQNAIQSEYQQLNGQYIASLKTFVKNHPKSAVSGYIVYNDFNNPNIPFEEVVETLSYIDKSLENTKFVKLANKRVDDKKGTTVGFKATNFSQANPEGKMVSLSDFKGKYVLVDFWASWCRPCRMENPNVVAAYNRFKDKGFTVLGVSMDSNRDPWLAAIKQDQLTWTHVSDLKGWGNEVGKIYNVTGIPQNFLIDKEGKIIAKDLRGAALDEKLIEILK
ncbi:MAG: TlpA disulfide reductase family protein [bacterium]|nr:TlpA disulfide reductase family protein [bacterium]